MDYYNDLNHINSYKHYNYIIISTIYNRFNH